MAKKRTKSLFSLTTLLASFFGAAMIAAAFAYFNYKFSEYKFMNFGEWVFYEKKTLFKPTAEKYIVLFYSSKVQDARVTLNSSQTQYPIIAVDFYQKSFESTPNVHYVKAGTNTLLKVIQRFNIYEVPSIFMIKKTNKNLYKQDSMVHKLKNIQAFQKSIKTL